MSPVGRGQGPEAQAVVAAAAALPAAAGAPPRPDESAPQDAGAAGRPAHPRCTVAVVIEREARPNRWEDWRFRIAEVLPDDDGAFGAAPRLLRDDGRLARWLHPGLAVELFRDEGEGYYLNLSSGAPAWFVTWRISDEDPSRAWPEAVTLSYNEAARWLDAQERVDNLPLPPDALSWLAEFTEAHYRPEPKQRRRPPSFLPPERRG